MEEEVVLAEVVAVELVVVPVEGLEPVVVLEEG